MIDFCRISASMWVLAQAEEARNEAASGNALAPAASGNLPSARVQQL